MSNKERYKRAFSQVCLSPKKAREIIAIAKTDPTISKSLKPQ